jgi:hypothetical protein
MIFKKKAGLTAGFFLRTFQGAPFNRHSENKVGGTVDRAEHRRSPFVVGAGNADI